VYPGAKWYKDKVPLGPHCKNDVKYINMVLDDYGLAVVGVNSTLVSGA